MNVHIEDSWKTVLHDELLKPYFGELIRTIRKAYRADEPVYPSLQYIFNAFELCPFTAVRVVILGQDPYHGKGQAHGLCFSVQKGVKIPPSLKNIYKEIQSDIGQVSHNTGDLTKWAEQGVLLLNTTLTVKEGRPASHQGLGWETFTDAVIRKISDERTHVVFLLWGKYAQSKNILINSSKHLVLQAPHPSPLSAYTGFFGCKHFSQANEYLTAQGEKEIVW
jgi:uracil-DNA glycosylase